VHISDSCRTSWSEAFWKIKVIGKWCWVVSALQAAACNTDTTPTQPHRNSNTHRIKNNKTNVVIQQNSRKLLMMDILMSETCWALKKWNKIASDIKLVFYSSTIWRVGFFLATNPETHQSGSWKEASLQIVCINFWLIRVKVTFVWLLIAALFESQWMLEMWFY